MNVLTDMYMNRIESEVDRLMKKKEKINRYEPLDFKLENTHDWLGHVQLKPIDGYQATKM